MSDVDTELLALPEAARRLGLTAEETSALIFTRQLRSVESPTGRRLVPIRAVDDWLASHSTST
jgi:hypothetical protein